MEKTSFLKTICIVAGHSGGHILPARTLALEWLAQNPSGRCIFFSSHKEFDKQLVSDFNASILYIPLKFNSVSFKKFWLFPFLMTRCIQSFFVSCWYLSKKNTEKVITTGGIIAIPVCMAAKLLKIPIELYELNVMPGKAIKFLAPISKKIYVCFSDTRHYFKKNCTATPYPLQATLQQKITPQQARHILGLNATCTTLLILGGSQGSLFINGLIKKWITQNTIKKCFQIIHQTGVNDTTDWKNFYHNYNISAFVIPYYENMNHLYNAADIVVCRSGAGTLFEIIHYQKLCVTIPLQRLADNHQVKNAHAMKKMHPNYITILSEESLENNDYLFSNVLHQLINT